MTNIGSKAFQNCVSLIAITIPESVKNIHERAFKGTSLQLIQMLSMKPSDINVDESAFQDIFDKCTLKVPEGTEDAYRSHPVFGKFMHIFSDTTQA